jgi:predicted alpha/beta hydrolase
VTRENDIWATSARLTRLQVNVTIGDMGRDLSFAARDGAPLVGTLFESARPRGAVLVAAATGVRARFYHPFARWLAEERALTALTFDFRGIGRSLVGKVSRCAATKVQWGASDLPGALDALAAACPGAPLFLVGNSAGGQLCGLMDNVGSLGRIAQVACSSGHLKHLSPRLRVGATLMLKGWIPVSNALLGYAAAKAIGWGEDLPRAVAQQWADWCSSPGYLENGFGTTIREHYHSAITAPLLNLSFTDDPIATDANVDDLLRLYPRAAIDKRRIRPVDVGMRAVGHVGFFRQGASALWPIVGDFLDGDRARRLPPREPAGSGARSG